MSQRIKNMVSRLIWLGGVGISTLVWAADASCPSVPDPVAAPRLSEAQLVHRLKQQGYKLRSLHENHCHTIEVKAWNREGIRVKIYVDPISGRVWAQENETES